MAQDVNDSNNWYDATPRVTPLVVHMIMDDLPSSTAAPAPASTLPIPLVGYIHTTQSFIHICIVHASISVRDVCY